MTAVEDAIDAIAFYTGLHQPEQSLMLKSQLYLPKKLLLLLLLQLHTAKSSNNQVKPIPLFL
jgi:hypothetical protein